MGNRAYASHSIRMISGLVGLLAALLIISPLVANAASSSLITKRLCDRQSALGSRLIRFLIDPNICNPTAEPTITLTADPTTIQEGNSSTLEWSSTNATSCTASNGWSGARNLSGNEVVSPLVTTTYTLACTGPGGSDSESVTVTVTETPPVAPTLTVVKVVVNNNGGTKEVADFPLFIDGTSVVSWATTTVATGVRTVSETNQTGYTSTIGGDCAANGTVTLVAGDVKKCTITNDDQLGTLIVKKVVIRDNGGSAATTTFSFQVNGGTAVAFEADGQNDLPVVAGTYTITEPSVDGYSASLDNCTNIVIANGGSATCTITNNDVVAPTTGHLIVNKVTQPAADTTTFAINASGSGAITGGGAGEVTDATDKNYEVAPGTYSVTETVPTGWTQVSNTCTSIVVDAGETENCTITNAKLPTLTVVKAVTNDNGGTMQIENFPLFVDSISIQSGQSTTTTIGAHTVSETNQTGYTATFSSDCALNGAVTLAAGDVKTCTITNNDNAPALDHLLISEVYYDVASTTLGTNSHNEWVEIFNPTAS